MPEFPNLNQRELAAFFGNRSETIGTRNPRGNRDAGRQPLSVSGRYRTMARL